MTVVQVAPLLRLPYGRDFYDYATDGPATTGSVVSIAFRGKKVRGVVIGPAPETKKKRTLLALEPLPQAPTLPATSIALFRFMREEYGVGYGVLFRSLSNFINFKKLSMIAPGYHEKLTQTFQTHPWMHVASTAEYQNAIREAYNQNTDAQILVLFPNTIRLEQAVAAAPKDLQPVAIHSGISTRALRKAGTAALTGNPILMFATRIGLFLPFTNVRAVLLFHENHEDYGPLEMTPRYCVADVALRLAHLHGAHYHPMGSAPSVPTYIRDLTAGAAPTVTGAPTTIVDMEARPKEERGISHECFALIEGAVREQKNIILIHEYSGKTATLRCRACSSLARCLHCHHALTQYGNRIRCNACRKSVRLPLTCQRCQSSNLVLQSGGIEQAYQVLERELKPHLAGVPFFLHRLSADNPTLPSKTRRPAVVLATSYVFDRIGAATSVLDPLGGVAVLSVDGLLGREEYTSAEVVFSRLTELAYASHEYGWPLLVQTRLATHPIFVALENGMLNNFYTQEIAERTQFGFPPATTMLTVRLREPIPTLTRFIKQYADTTEIARWDSTVVLRWKAEDAERRRAFQSLLLDRFAGKLTIDIR